MRLMALSLTAAVSISSPGVMAMAAGGEIMQEQNEAQTKEVYNYAEDFTGGTQGPVWYHEYKNGGTRYQYDNWVADWNCWTALNDRLTSGLEQGMGLIAPTTGADSLYTWEAPKAGTVEVSQAHLAFMRRTQYENGIEKVYIEKNGEKIYPVLGEMILHSNDELYLAPVPVEVQAGDRISVGVTYQAGTDVSTRMTPVITYVDQMAEELGNAAWDAEITASSTASGYDPAGLKDYSVSSKHSAREWKAEGAQGQWVNFALKEKAKVSRLVFVDSKSGAYTGAVKCTFDDGTVETVTADQMSGDGVHVITLSEPKVTTAVKMEFVDNGDTVPALGDVQLLTEAPQEVSIILNDDGEETEVKVSEYSMMLGDKLPTPKKAGYRFVEWNTQADGKGETVTGDYVFDGPATIYAIYEEIEGGVTYYVDSEEGSDENDGRSADAAWKTLDKVNANQYAPGDKILFKAGTSYTGALVLTGDGTEEAPIIVDMYGEGDKPAIHGEGQVRHTVHLKNVNYVTVRNLEITNNSTERKLLTGVCVEASGCGVMQGIHLDGLDVHDVYGTLLEKTQPNGGIYCVVTNEKGEISAKGDTVGDTRFNDISVENCTVKRVSRTGISVGMTTSYGFWDGHGGIIPEDVKETYGHTNVVIRNNYVEESGGDAIVPMFSIEPLIEYNISNGASINTKDNYGAMYNAAIWPWRCEDAVFQYNEAYNTYENGDGQAYDCDYSRHTVYQYNYSHDNGGGFMLVCQTESLDSVIRYNVSQNDHDSLFLMSNPDTADVYNNTFYIGPNLKKVVDLTGRAHLRNNIFYCPEGVALPGNSWGSGFTYDNNLFYGFATTPNDPNKIIADPLFVDPGKGGTGTEPGKPALDTLGGYRLQEDSPAINAGLTIEDNGGQDLAGHEVGSTKQDLGAFETDVIPLMTLGWEEKTVTDATEPLKIETKLKEGSKLEGDITYTTSNENVAEADREGNVRFYGYGTAVIGVSAMIDGKEVNLKCRVTLKASDLENHKKAFAAIYANTEDVTAPATNIIDGNYSSIWDANWHGDGFVVSAENPAILTLELKEDAPEYNGFRILQRPSQYNGIIEEFRYVVGNEFDQKSNQITDGVLSDTIIVENRTNGTWIDVDLPAGVTGKYIQVQVLSGGNTFGTIAEIETYNKTSYMTEENELVIIQNKVKKAQEESTAAAKEAKEAAEAAKTAKDEALTARSGAETAVAEAASAQEKAEQAQKQAEEAKKAAEDARTKAEEAKATAGDAAKTAQEAAEVAEKNAKLAEEAAKTAVSGAEAAQEKAEAAQKKAENAESKAAESAKAAGASETAALAAQAAAQTAKEAAESFKEDAEKASEMADRAQKDAEMAKEQAAAAKNDAVQAKNEAVQAKEDTVAAKEEAKQQASAAAEAKNLADQAKSAAEDAARVAESASEAALASAKAAKEAQLKAEAAAQKADEILQKAKKEAEALQQKLENLFAAAQFKETKAVLKSVKSTKKKQAQAAWKKVEGAEGYVLQYAANSRFKKAKTVKIKSAAGLRKTVKKLRSNKKYYFRIKAYRTMDGKMIYTKYSNKKIVKVK